MTYDQAIAWIAENQGDAITAPNGDERGGCVASLDTVMLVSDCFGVDIEIVVDNVCRAHRNRRVSVAAVRKAAR